MGKRTKEHRKKVAARNRRLEQNRNTLNKRLQEEFLKELEAEKARRIKEDPEFAAKVEAYERKKAEEEAAKKELEENGIPFTEVPPID